MYIDTTYSQGPKVADMLMNEVEPLLVKHRVDLALWGHHHSYQRTCHVQGRRCLAPSGGVGPYTAPVHFVVGMAGFSLTKGIQPVRPAWAEYVNVDEWGVGLITASQEALRMQFILNVDGSVGDEVFLTSAQHGGGDQLLRGGREGSLA